MKNSYLLVFSGGYEEVVESSLDMEDFCIEYLDKKREEFEEEGIVVDEDWFSYEEYFDDDEDGNSMFEMSWSERGGDCEVYVR